VEKFFSRDRGGRLFEGLKTGVGLFQTGPQKKKKKKKSQMRGQGEPQCWALYSLDDRNRRNECPEKVNRGVLVHGQEAVLWSVAKRWRDMRWLAEAQERLSRFLRVIIGGTT